MSTPKRGRERHPFFNGCNFTRTVQKKREKNTLPLIMPSDLLLFRFMVLFALGFMIGKVEGRGTFT